MSEDFLAKDIKDILLKNGGYLTVNKSLIHSIGLNEAIIYHELISKWVYYQDISERNEFFCTQDDLERSTGLSQTAQKTAIKRLQNLKLIDYIVKGMPRKTHYIILNTVDDENEHIIITYINNGDKIIELMKEYNTKRNELKNTKLNQMDIFKIEEIESELKEIKVKIKNLKL